MNAKDKRDMMAKILSRSVKSPNGCILWTGASLKKKIGNYGFIYVEYEKRNRLVHRVSYQISKGRIPKELVIDHRCNQPLCVNPKHLKAVTPRENILRGTSPWAINARKTHCPQGHPYLGKNLILRRYSGKLGRWCKSCQDANIKRQTLKISQRRRLARLTQLEGTQPEKENQ